VSKPVFAREKAEVWAKAEDDIPPCKHPSQAQKWFELRREIAVRWCSECGALNRDGETWEQPARNSSEQQ
jgi:hypothetical protein